MQKEYLDATNPGEWERNRLATLSRLSGPEPNEARLAKLEGRPENSDAPAITPA